MRSFSRQLASLCLLALCCGFDGSSNTTAAEASEAVVPSPLLEALVVPSGSLDVLLPPVLYSEALANGCKARIQSLGATVAPPPEITNRTRILSGGDPPLIQRDFFHGEFLLCTEAWQGEPDKGLLQTAAIYGETVTLDYDHYGRLVSRTHEDMLTDAEDRVTRYEYPSPGEMIIDGPREDVHDVRQLSFDEDGNVVQFVNAAGHRVAMEYDGHGRLIVWTGPNGNRREYEYDARGRVIQERAAVGTRDETSVELTYDAAGRLIASQRQGEGAIRRQYDENGRLAAVSDASGARLELRYAWDGLLQGVWASEALMDSHPGLVSSRFPLSSSAGASDGPAAGGREATSSGRRTQEGPGLQRRNDPVSHQYDLLGRAVSAVSADGSLIHYEHNGFGEVIAAHDSLGLTTQYAYDASGNRVREYASDGTDIWRAFDALGRLSRADAQRPGALPEHLAYRYDDCANGIGRLCEVRTGAGATRYEYDALGKAIEISPLFAGRESAIRHSGAPGAETRSPESPSVTQATPPSSASTDIEFSSSPGIFGEYYRDAFCAGSGFSSMGTMGLGDAYLAGFRSYTVSREATLFIDSVRILVTVAVCYQIHGYVEHFVFVGIPQPGISITTSPTVWYIDRNSKMPTITLTAALSNAGTASGLTYNWKLEANYGTFGGTATGSTRSDTWQPNWGSDLFGGAVTVEVSTVVNGKTIKDEVDGYAIHGLNPTSKQLSSHMADPWFFAKLVRAESSCMQFFPSRGGPPRTDGGGYGLTQITFNPNRTIVWNWAENIKEGKSRLSGFKTRADDFWNSQDSQWKDYNSFQRDWGGTEATPPRDRSYSGETFGYSGTGKRPLSNGIWIQLYNGNGPSGAMWIVWENQDWESWRNRRPRPAIEPLAYWEYNDTGYVGRVLGQTACP